MTYLSRWLLIPYQITNSTKKLKLIVEAQNILYALTVLSDNIIFLCNLCVAKTSGAHTIGSARCATFSARLFNFSGTGAPDASMTTSLVNKLQTLCPVNGDGNQTTALDQNSTDLFDNHYFKNLINNRGVLLSDQDLYSSNTANSTTKTIVESYSNDQTLFFNDFINSMIKMGNINPLTGSSGQIRTNCRAINS